MNFVQSRGKIVTNKIMLPDAVSWMQKLSEIYLHSGLLLGELTVRSRLPLSQLLVAAITCGKVSLWLWKSLENLGILSSTSWQPRCDVMGHVIVAWLVAVQKED